MRSANKLSALAVAKMSKPGCYADGHGLYLQVARGGSKSWLLRYMRDGRARKMGLGPIHLVTLAMARAKAIEAQRRLLEGVDPIDERQEAEVARKLAKASAVTFRQAADRYIAAHRAGWRNAKHAAQWDSTLETYIYPVFADLPVAAVDVGLVLKALEPIWTAKPETASRVRGRIESVLDWAAARGYRSSENPARWRGLLDKLLPSRNKVRKVKHHAALPYRNMGVFMAELRAMEGIYPRAIEFLVLTAARSNEVIGARWGEVDFENRTWVVPPGRMKSGREHKVPLSDAAIDLLNQLPREDGSDLVFLGTKKGRPLPEKGLVKFIRRAGQEDATAHGMRSAFRDWGAEQTAYPSEVLELALAHTVGSKVELAYRRGDQFEKRRRLMSDWADFCAMPARTGEVVPIRG